MNINPRLVFIMFLYLFLINLLVYSVSLSVIGGSVDDFDFYASVGSGKIVPNSRFFDEDTGRMYDGDYDVISDSTVVDNFKNDTKDESGIMYFINMFVAKWLDLHDAEHDTTAGGTPYGDDEGLLSSFFGAFDTFIGSVFLAFNFLLGFFSFSIINVLGSVMVVPEYLQIFLFISVLPVYLFVAFWLAPYAIIALGMIAHWIEALIPF